MNRPSYSEPKSEARAEEPKVTGPLSSLFKGIASNDPYSSSRPSAKGKRERRQMTSQQPRVLSLRYFIFFANAAFDKAFNTQDSSSSGKRSLSSVDGDTAQPSANQLPSFNSYNASTNSALLLDLGIISLTCCNHVEVRCFLIP